MEIQFWGAARCVTGSMHLLKINGKNILLDCGLYQGSRKLAYERNKELPFAAGDIDTLILSHAHIDHSGNIPLLVNQGFSGNIYCTHATHDLANVMLRDSAHIQEKDAEFLNKKKNRQGLPPVEPLYTMKDADNCVEQFVGLGYNRTFPVNQGVSCTFFDAGHILGSAIVVLDIEEKGVTRRLTFTGDLGRKHLPVIRDPVQVKETDFYITESTYGNRVHEPFQDMKEEIHKVVDATIKRGGKVIIPSFSMERTQELVYVLHELMNENRLPEVPIFVDSPLSVNITEIFRLHPECYDQETRKTFLENHLDPFGFHRLRYIRNVEESKKLNTMNEPCLIISASGMCEAGRILHHLANNISDPKNTILIVGFMAENTLGRRIAEEQEEVRIFGDMIPRRAQVAVMHGFSAHAGQDELMAYFNGLKRERLQQVFIVHGEEEQSRALAGEMQKSGFENVSIPDRGQIFTL